LTTLDRLQTGLANFATIVLVEGLEYAICDCPTSQAIAALTQTEWTQAIGGLQVNWNLKQRLEPWTSFVDTSHVAFGVQPDENDTLGELLFATTAGNETVLTASLDCRQQVVTVASTANFSSSGSIHIGTEQIAYTGKTATTFTGCTRGKYAPHRVQQATRRSQFADARFFGRAHPLPAIGDGYVVAPRVTSQQRTWLGRKVGIFIVARTDGALDTLANAQCIFAGRIAGFRDEANGMSWVEVESVLSEIKNTVVLRDQWTAKVRAGIQLRSGERFVAYDYTSAASTTRRTANDLVVVSSGATGTNEINAGTYKLDELTTYVNDWLTAERNAGTPRLNFRWTYQPVVSIAGSIRSAFHWSGGSTTTTGYTYFQAPPDVLEFMGWISEPAAEENRVVQISTVQGVITGIQQSKHSTATPMVSFIRTVGDSTIQVTDVRGTWWNNKEYLNGVGIPRASTDSYALIRMGDEATSLMLCVEETPGSTIRVYNPGADQILNGQYLTADPLASIRKIYYGSTASDIPLRQVAQITGDFGQLMTTFLASTGTRGYNHPTWDKLPEQLSVGVPWELLGDAWLASAEHVAESGADLTIRIDKPKKFGEVFNSDLVARLAFFVWKNEGLRIATWAIPASAISQHILNEANKAEPIDAQADHRTVAVETDDFLVNAIKLQYNQNDSGKFAGTINIIDKSSQYELGIHRPVSIELPNLNGDDSNATARKIADGLAAMGRILARPLRVIRRTIAPEYYENMAPGDICLVSDDFVRDPATGQRGITSRAAMVISHEVDYGGYEIDTGHVRPPMGQVDLLLWPADKVRAHSPTASVRNTAANGGYNAGTLTITVYDHDHSTEDEDIDRAFFAEDDAVRIIEVDPDDPANPLTWTTTIVSFPGDGEVELADALTGWVSTRRYRMISAGYSSASTGQQARAFQATTDYMIEDSRSADEYGVNTGTINLPSSDLSSSVPRERLRSTGNELPALYATAAYGDGAPLDVGYETDAAVLVNNLIRWRTAPIMPAMTDTEKIANDVVLPSGTLIRALLATEPVVFPPCVATATPSLIAVRAWARTSSARTTLRVTLARRPAYGSAYYCTDEDSPVYGWERPAQTEEVTLSSTSWGATQLMLFEHSIVDPVDGLAFFMIEGGPDAEYEGLCLCQLIPGDVRVPPLSWRPVISADHLRRRRMPQPGGCFYVRLP
jgi:hypothetical protein